MKKNKNKIKEVSTAREHFTFFRTFVAVVCTVYQGSCWRVSIYYDLTLAYKSKPFKPVKLDGRVSTSETENLRLLFAT